MKRATVVIGQRKMRMGAQVLAPMMLRSLLVPSGWHVDEVIVGCLVRQCRPETHEMAPTFADSNEPRELFVRWVLDEETFVHYGQIVDVALTMPVVLGEGVTE